MRGEIRGHSRGTSYYSVRIVPTSRELYHGSGCTVTRACSVVRVVRQRGFKRPGCGCEHPLAEASGCCCLSSSVATNALNLVNEEIDLPDTSSNAALALPGYGKHPKATGHTSSGIERPSLAESVKKWSAVHMCSQLRSLVTWSVLDRVGQTGGSNDGDGTTS